MPIVNDGTGSGLLAFLDWAGTRGEIPIATAQAMAVAAGKVLAVEADPQGADLRQLDPEDVFGRFETLHRLDYTSASIKAYRSRFFRAFSMYLAWLDKRPDWKMTSYFGAATGQSTRPSRDSKAAANKRKPTVKADSAPSNASRTSAISMPESTEAMVPYDLPLRPGLRVRLVLPELLTSADAKRIKAFVDSLAFDQAEMSQEGAG